MTSTVKSSIRVEDVSKIYVPSPPWMKALVRSNISESVTALKDINFSVDPGEIVAVVGPNGAGKTTTFRILVGLTTPTTGTAHVMGYNAETESNRVRSLVGWMPGDDRSLLMRLTCAENLRFHGRLQGMRPKALDRRVKEVLEMVDLGDAAQKTIFALSAGMRARIQLARALVHRPDVLILDEPTGAVDPVAAHGLLNLIIEIVRDQQLGALLSSHRLEEIEALQARVILLDRGRIRYDGDLETLRDRLDRPCLEFQFSGPESAQRAIAAVDAAETTTVGTLVEPDTVRFILDRETTPGTVLTRFESILPEIIHMAEVQRPLRDLLAEIYGVGETQQRGAGNPDRDEQRRNRNRNRGDRNRNGNQR